MAEQILKLFSSDLQKNLFPSNAFYKQSRLDGGINVKAKNVEIPQSGAVPAVLTNPTVFPLTINQRTDDTKTYAVDLLATEPIHLEDENEIITNYNKRADILEDHVMVLNARAALLAAYAWSPASSTLSTTGAARPSGHGGADVKAVTYDDIVALQTQMDKDDIPEEGRFLLIEPDMYADLLKIDQFISFDYKDKAVSNGVIGTILGFQVYKRSKTAVYDLNGDLKGIDDATATTDNSSILAWHKSFVRRAEGNVKVYADTDKPEYLGSIYNAAVRFGGTAGRNDGKGVYSLVQVANV